MDNATLDSLTYIDGEGTSYSPTIVPLAIAVLLTGCAGTTATFHPTDAAHIAVVSPSAPVVYTADQVPTEAVRSVGLIKIVASSRAGATEAAATKGGQVGCRAVFEHKAFEAWRIKAGARLVPVSEYRHVHGGIDHSPAPVMPSTPAGPSGGPSVGGPSGGSNDRISLSFDCLVSAGPAPAQA